MFETLIIIVIIAKGLFVLFILLAIWLSIKSSIRGLKKF